MAELFGESEADRYEMHGRYLNEQMVRVLRAIGYDVGFVAAPGSIFMIVTALNTWTS